MFFLWSNKFCKLSNIYKYDIINKIKNQRNNIIIIKLITFNSILKM